MSDEGMVLPLVVDMSDFEKAMAKAPDAVGPIEERFQDLTRTVKMTGDEVARLTQRLQQTAAVSQTQRMPPTSLPPGRAWSGIGAPPPPSGQQPTPPGQQPTPPAQQPTQVKPPDDITQSVPILRTGTGAQQRVIRAQLDLQNAQFGGDPGKIADASLAQQRAQAASLKAQQQLAGDTGGKKGADFGDRLDRLISSTRIGVDSHGNIDFMPLIGQIGGLFGKSSPIGLAVAATASEFMLLKGLLSGLQSSLTGFQQGRFLSGATSKEMATLQTFGAAVGLKSEDMSSMARQFATTLATNPVAQVQFGQRNMPGFLGGLDQAKMLMQGISTVLTAPIDQATRAAREAGPQMEQFLQLRLANAPVAAMMAEEIQNRMKVMGGMGALGVNMQAAGGVFGMRAEDLRNQVTKEIMGYREPGTDPSILQRAIDALRQNTIPGTPNWYADQAVQQYGNIVGAPPKAGAQFSPNSPPEAPIQREAPPLNTQSPFMPPGTEARGPQKVSMAMHPGKKYASLLPPEQEESTFAAPVTSGDPIKKQRALYGGGEIAPPPPTFSRGGPEGRPVSQDPMRVLPYSRTPPVPVLFPQDQGPSSAGISFRSPQQRSLNGIPVGGKTPGDTRDYRADPNAVMRVHSPSTDELLYQIAGLLKDMNRQVRGGGERAQGATPSHARFMNTNQFLSDMRLRVGMPF